MKTIENILYILVLICMSALAIMSIIVWQNFVIATMFALGVILWVGNIKEIFQH